MTVKAASNKQYKYGPGQDLDLRQRNGKRVKLTVFKSAPFYNMAEDLRVGEKVQIEGWLKKYGRDSWVKAYKLRKL